MESESLLLFEQREQARSTDLRLPHKRVCRPPLDAA